jgi:hypothetical protein
LNPFQTVPPGTMLAGPTYRCTTIALPRSPFSLPYPPLTLGPRLVPAPPVSRAPLLRDNAAARTRRPPLLLLHLPHGHARRAPAFFPSLPCATEALEKPTSDYAFSSRQRPSSSSPPLHRLHVCLASSHHRRPLLLSGFRPSATAYAPSR